MDDSNSDHATQDEMASQLLFLNEELEHGLDRIHEVVAQHNSEAAQFGDSWPGAQIQIRDSFDALREGCKQMNHLRNSFGLEPITFHLPSYWRG